MSEVRKLKFDKYKYGQELLFDTVDMEDFDPGGEVVVPGFYTMACMENCSGTMQIQETSIELQKYKMLFIPPGTLSKISEADLESGIFLFFEAEFLDLFFNDKFFIFKFAFFHGVNSPFDLNLTVESFPIIYQHFKDLHHEMRNLRSDSDHFLRSTLYTLLIRLNRYYAEAYEKSSAILSDSRMLHFKYLLESKIKELRTVQEFAEQLQISRTHLNKLALKFLGKTSKEVINERRIVEIKKELLYSEKDAAQIAYDLSFSDPANFNRFFKQYAGRTPQQFRREFSN